MEYLRLFLVYIQESYVYYKFIKLCIIELIFEDIYV